MKFDLETIVVAVSFITSFFAVFLSNGVIIGVPAIAQEFAMNNVIQNWVPTIFFLVVALFTVPAGQISGKFGVKKSLLGGVLVYLFASIGCVLSFSTESFIFFRALQGAGVAFLNVSAMAMVSLLYPHRSFSRAVLLRFEEPFSSHLCRCPWGAFLLSFLRLPF